MECPHCGSFTLSYIEADEPWNDEHWQCARCDSTYPIDEFDMETPYDDD
jgi:uncharacterized protein YbaR (Trm112 family)